MGAEQQYVVFRLEQQLYGTPVSVVREVSHVLPVTRVPSAPPYVDGVVDLRAEVLPVVNLRRRLGLAPREPDRESRLIVLLLGEQAVAVLVDGLDQVVTFHPEMVTPPDERLGIAGEEFVTGIAREGEELVLLLDLAGVLEEE